MKRGRSLVDLAAEIERQKEAKQDFLLAETALPALQEAGAQIESCEVTDRHLYLKAIMPERREEIWPAGISEADREWGRGNHQVDVVQPGIVIRNSEVGAGALSVSPAVHTVHCSNLAIWNEGSMRRYHLGGVLGERGSSEIQQYLTDETRRLSDAAVWSQVRDLVTASMVGDVFQAIVADLREARGEKIEGDPVKAVEVLAKGERLNEDERTGVLRHLIEGGDFSRYGLHAAVTRAAADVDSYDRASEMEVLGGRVAVLEGNDWQRIATAA